MISQGCTGKLTCPKCGESSSNFTSKGLEVGKEFTKIFMSATCYVCRADIELEYTVSLCEVDEEALDEN